LAGHILADWRGRPGGFLQGFRLGVGKRARDNERMDRRQQALSNPFMARAIQLSIEGVQSGRGGPFGAVIVKNGKIIAEGSNEVTSTNDPTAHAEVLAIRRACEKLGVFELKDCELYTSCEPCPMCLGAIYWARLSRIYFASTAEDAAKAGFDDSFIYSELKQPYSERRIPTIQIMREEALAGFRAWADRPGKIPY
jgi:guanine deaminase